MRCRSRSRWVAEAGAGTAFPTISTTGISSTSHAWSIRWRPSRCASRPTTSCSATIDAATACSRRGMRTFRDVVDEKARRFSSAPLLLAPEAQATLTYADLRRCALSFAGDLQRGEIAAGAVVGFMLPNGASAASIFLSAMYGGYIVLPINLLAQDSQLDHILRHAAPATIFVAPDFEVRLRSSVDRTGARTSVQTVSIDGLGDCG